MRKEKGRCTVSESQAWRQQGLSGRKLGVGLWWTRDDCVIGKNGWRHGPEKTCAWKDHGGGGREGTGADRRHVEDVDGGVFCCLLFAVCCQCWRMEDVSATAFAAPKVLVMLYTGRTSRADACCHAGKATRCGRYWPCLNHLPFCSLLHPPDPLSCHGMHCLSNSRLRFSHPHPLFRPSVWPRGSCCWSAMHTLTD